MYHGGTSFGFMNGALEYQGKFRAMTTSYDYDAPISETGQLTPKYFAIRKVISKVIIRMAWPPHSDTLIGLLVLPRHSFGSAPKQTSSGISSRSDGGTRLNPMGSD